MTKFKAGDRVRYRTEPVPNSTSGSYYTLSWAGRTATVVADSNVSGTRIRWDDTRTHDLPNTYNLELIGMRIDTTKPLETFGATLTAASATFITETSDGNILVGTPGGNSSWIIFDKQGKFVRSEKNTGAALVLRNKVECVVVYQGIAQVAKGYIMSSTYDDPETIRRLGKQVVKVTSENGRVVSVELLS